MSFQAYLDNIEQTSGLTPRELLTGMAMVHVITKGPQISAKHVDSGGTHSDPTDTLWLDGMATNPQR